MVYSLWRYFDANPKKCAAFLAALDEANGFINCDRRAVAQIYLRVAKVKTTGVELLRILDDPDTAFTVVPNGVLKFVEFMGRAGTINIKPETWTDLFAPVAHRLNGS